MPTSISLDDAHAAPTPAPPPAPSVPAPGATGAQQQANAEANATIQQSAPDTDGLCTLTGVTNELLKGRRFALDYVKQSFDQGDRRFWIIAYACGNMESELSGGLAAMGVVPTGVVFDVERHANGTWTQTGNHELANAFAVPARCQTKEDAVAWINTHGPTLNPDANGEGFHP